MFEWAAVGFTELEAGGAADSMKVAVMVAL
jgi:hypothetical protein